MAYPKKGTPEYEAWILTPEYREHCKHCSKRMSGEKHPNFGGKLVTPDWKRKQSIAHTGVYFSEERCKKNARIGEKHPMFGKHHTEETKKLISDANIGEKNPNFGGKSLTNESKIKISIANTGRKRPDVAAKNRDGIFRLKITETTCGGFWYGNVDNDPPEYCELWEDVNPRVHAFFNYECCLCHVPETGNSHAGHHVFYVKKACCWQSEDGTYYTNLNASDHYEHDYYIGKNPNYFVILCPHCHGLVGGKFAKRKKWADYFRNMINEKYGGICYLPKEEMIKFQRV